MDEAITAKLKASLKRLAESMTKEQMDGVRDQSVAQFIANCIAMLPEAVNKVIERDEPTVRGLIGTTVGPDAAGDDTTHGVYVYVVPAFLSVSFEAILNLVYVRGKSEYGEILPDGTITHPDGDRFNVKAERQPTDQ